MTVWSYDPSMLYVITYRLCKLMRGLKTKDLLSTSWWPERHKSKPSPQACVHLYNAFSEENFSDVLWDFSILLSHMVLCTWDHNHLGTPWHLTASLMIMKLLACDTQRARTLSPWQQMSPPPEGAMRLLPIPFCLCKCSPRPPPLSLCLPRQLTNHNFAGRNSFIWLLVMNPHTETSPIKQLTPIWLDSPNILWKGFSCWICVTHLTLQNIHIMHSHCAN